MAEERKTDRFTLRRDRTGWTVFEVWTGEPAVIAMVHADRAPRKTTRNTGRRSLLNRRVPAAATAPCGQ